MTQFRKPLSARTFCLLRFGGLYILYFSVGLGFWVCVQLMTVLFPFLSWQFPPAVLFLGLAYPFGAPLSLHFLNHIAQTWLPFLAAFGVAFWTTKGRAKFVGAAQTYALFLLWSAAMVSLFQSGVSLDSAILIGFSGIVLGGGVCTFRLIKAR